MGKKKEEVELTVMSLFDRIVAAQVIEDAAAKELAVSLLKEECDTLEKIKSDVTGKWVIDNDPAILNAHQVREQAIVLVPVTEEVAEDEE